VVVVPSATVVVASGAALVVVASGAAVVVDPSVPPPQAASVSAMTEIKARYLR
jgi:hypothetical protein